MEERNVNSASASESRWGVNAGASKAVVLVIFSALDHFYNDIVTTGATLRWASSN